VRRITFEVRAEKVELQPGDFGYSAEGETLVAEPETASSTNGFEYSVETERYETSFGSTDIDFLSMSQGLRNNKKYSIIEERKKQEAKRLAELAAKAQTDVIVPPEEEVDPTFFIDAVPGEFGFVAGDEEETIDGTVAEVTEVIEAPSVNGAAPSSNGTVGEIDFLAAAKSLRRIRY